MNYVISLLNIYHGGNVYYENYLSFFEKKTRFFCGGWSGVEYT